MRRRGGRQASLDEVPAAIHAGPHGSQAIRFLAPFTATKGEDAQGQGEGLPQPAGRTGSGIAAEASRGAAGMPRA